MRRMLFAVLAVCALLSPFGTEPSLAQQVNTTTAGEDLYFGLFWGVSSPGSEYIAFGQIFESPSTATVLDDFSFFLADYSPLVPSTNTFLYRAYLGSWNGSSITSILWESDHQPNVASPDNPFTGRLQDYAQVTFTPRLALTPGDMYLAFLFPSISGINPEVDFFALKTRRESQGEFDGNGRLMLMTGMLGGTLRYQPEPLGDAAFIANFSGPVVSVPEPQSMILLVTGLLGLGCVGRRRRRAA